MPYIDEKDLINVAKDIAALEDFVHDHYIKDYTKDDISNLECLVHYVSAGYCTMLKSVLFESTFTTRDLLIDLGYKIKNGKVTKENDLKEDVQREKVKGEQK